MKWRTFKNKSKMKHKKKKSRLERIGKFIGDYF